MASNIMSRHEKDNVKTKLLSLLSYTLLDNQFPYLGELNEYEVYRKCLPEDANEALQKLIEVSTKYGMIEDTKESAVMLRLSDVHVINFTFKKPHPAFPSDNRYMGLFLPVDKRFKDDEKIRDWIKESTKQKEYLYEARLLLQELMMNITSANMFMSALPEIGKYLQWENIKPSRIKKENLLRLLDENKEQIKKLMQEIKRGNMLKMLMFPEAGKTKTYSQSIEILTRSI